MFKSKFLYLIILTIGLAIWRFSLFAAETYQGAEVQFEPPKYYPDDYGPQYQNMADESFYRYEDYRDKRGIASEENPTDNNGKAIIQETDPEEVGTHENNPYSRPDIPYWKSNSHKDW